VRLDMGSARCRPKPRTRLIYPPGGFFTDD
jgi:hypothetical protein